MCYQSNMSKIYMTCNVDESATRDYSFYSNREAAEQAKAFLEQEHIELEEEYEMCMTLFGARPNWEPTIFEIPYVGTWQPEGEAYFVKTDESGEYPLQFVVVVFDDAWEGKEPKWSFFERYRENAYQVLEMRVTINNTFKG